VCNSMMSEEDAKTRSEEDTKTGKIRVYLQELVSGGELDLSRPVPNAKLREWAEALKERYGEDFNVNTVGVVLRELRVAYHVNELVHLESDEDTAVVSESGSSSDPSGSVGGDALAAAAFVGVLAVGFVGAVVGLWYWSQRK